MNINDYKDVNGNVLVSEQLVSDLIGEINTHKAEMATQTVIPFPYNSGYSDYNAQYKTLVSKNAMNEVKINFYVTKNSGNYVLTEVIVGILPVGFRPKANIEITARTYPNTLGAIRIYTDGIVAISMIIGESNYASGSVVFDAN